MKEQLEYEVIVNKQKADAAVTWCRKTLGEQWSVTGNRAGLWSCFWMGPRPPNQGSYRFVFKNERDAMWFSLQWL